LLPQYFDSIPPNPGADLARPANPWACMLRHPASSGKHTRKILNVLFIKQPLANHGLVCDFLQTMFHGTELRGVFWSKISPEITFKEGNCAAIQPAWRD
jgi:hypothetical protein